MTARFAGMGSAALDATTVVRARAFQGRDFRVHFDEDAPPDCGATTVVGQPFPTLPTWAIPGCAP
jgi:hypothetical protein